MPPTAFHHWKPAKLFSRLNAPFPLKHWLLDKGSLTAKLRQTCPKMNVKVLSETWQLPMAEEAKLLGLSYNQKAWVRCVVLHCQGQPLVYARTVIPNCQAGNPWFGLKQLGNQPLGEVLFQLKNIRRSHFEISEIKGRRWPQLKGFDRSDTLARRSIFWKKQAPLLLTEAFLTVDI